MHQVFQCISQDDEEQNYESDLYKYYCITMLRGLRGGVAQWVARLTCDRWIPVSREFEPHQMPPLFP